MFYSPLRYPGGKNRLSKFIASICKTNKVNGHYIEPYAGGASVALFLLFHNYVNEITINDYDRSIYSFWHSVLNDTDKFCDKIKNVKVDLNNWERQKKIQRSKNREKNLLKLGFSTLFLNRTNYSGIIDGGVIGGQKQKSKYKIDCRFNKEELIYRVQLIASYKKYIHIRNLDALKLVKNIKHNKDAIFYFDPPYFLKGPSLYLNHYNDEDHKKVSQEIQKIKNARWIVSYDNTFEIKKLYQKCAKKEYTLFHSAHSNRIGKEILIFSNNLVLPEVIPSPVS